MAARIWRHHEHADIETARSPRPSTVEDAACRRHHDDHRDRSAAEQVEDAQANVDDRQSLEEIVGDKGYHSNQTLIDLDAVGIRSYVSEPDRGRRDWSKDPEARAPVYGNRRRMRGRRGRRLMRPNAANGSNARLRISTTRAGCGAPICAATRTS